MKVPLDENLPHKLRAIFAKHQVFTVVYLGWNGESNGEFLNRAEQEGSDVLITADQNLKYQQNLETRLIALVLLTAQEWDLIRLNLDQISLAVDEAQASSYQPVDCSRFIRT